MANDPELEEYFVVVKNIAEFDQRLLTVKSWGVTLSLAALGLGFQFRSYGMFLVAAASSLAFWSLEGVMKRHQMRYYQRMREIEVNRYLRAPEANRTSSAPRIDWSWVQAIQVFQGRQMAADLAPQPSGASKAYARAWLLPHVALPHAITFGIALALFVFGWIGWLGFAIGAAEN